MYCHLRNHTSVEHFKHAKFIETIKGSSYFSIVLQSYERWTLFKSELCLWLARKSKGWHVWFLYHVKIWKYESALGIKGSVFLLIFFFWVCKRIAINQHILIYCCYRIHSVVFNWLPLQSYSWQKFKCGNSMKFIFLVLEMPKSFKDSFLITWLSTLM